MKNYVFQALENISLHARLYARSAHLSGDEKSAFVYNELAIMLRGLTEMKRSPLFDEINNRIATKAREGAYQDVRKIGIALTVLRMKNGLTRRHASQMAAGVTGVSMNVIEKNSGVPSGVKLLDSFLMQNPDVSEAIAAHRLMTTSGSDEETIAALERNGETVAKIVAAETWRRDEIAKSFNVKSDEDDNFRLVKEFLADALREYSPDLM